MQIRTREATVTGTVEVTIPELGIEETAVPEFGELRLATELCPPRGGQSSRRRLSSRGRVARADRLG